jgi:hypothetical protein
LSIVLYNCFKQLFDKMIVLDYSWLTLL